MSRYILWSVSLNFIRNLIFTEDNLSRKSTSIEHILKLQASTNGVLKQIKDTQILRSSYKTKFV